MQCQKLNAKASHDAVQPLSMSKALHVKPSLGASIHQYACTLKPLLKVAKHIMCF